MQKLIPTIYFYTLSLIGFILLIIGIFASIHFIINITQYSKYPLGYDPSRTCAAPVMQPIPVKSSDGTIAQPLQIPSSYQACLNGIEDERKQLQTSDLEKAISFTLIGLLVFGIHFFYARRRMS